MHRRRSSLDVRKVARIAVDLLESLAIDISSDVLEIERRDPDIAPNVVGWVLMQAHQRDTALAERTAVRVPHVEACGERTDP